MAASNCSVLSLLSFLFLLLVVIRTDSTDIHNYYLGCLHSQTSDYINSSSIIYTPKNSAYWSVLRSSEQNLRPAAASPLKPTLILAPFCESQIQVAIKCAKKHGIQIRVRSGGHDYEGLSYISSIPFVILDLRNLSSISIDTEKQTAWIHAGATLGELYHKIAEKSRTLAFVAGICPTVGVGGHFSGGGYGMMSRKFGVAVDHIIDAKIIDVNGQILDRKSMGEDLFWAIRGGGGGTFGIVIAWKVNLLSIPEKVTVFNLTKTLEQNATQLLHRWQYIADKIDHNLVIKPFMAVVNSSQTGKRTIQVTFNSLFLGGVKELLSIMHQTFPELGLVKEDCTELSWIQSVLFFADFGTDEPIDVLLNRTPLGRAYFKGKSDFVKQPISVNGLEGIWERLLEEDGVVQVQFSPYGGRLSEISDSATPFPHRAGNIYMIHYVVAWGNNSDSQRHINWIRRLYSYMASYVSNSPREAYLNYRDLDVGMNNEGSPSWPWGLTSSIWHLCHPSYSAASIWGTKYFKNNFDRLVHVKTKVDPSNFFRNEQSIPPCDRGRDKFDI